MSYILEALKKSDQQRQRHATPTLPGAQPAPTAPRRRLLELYALPGILLLGIGIGWLRPWHTEQTTPASVQQNHVAHDAPKPVQLPAAIATRVDASPGDSAMIKGEPGIAQPPGTKLSALQMPTTQLPDVNARSALPTPPLSATGNRVIKDDAASPPTSAATSGDISAKTHDRHHATGARPDSLPPATPPLSTKLEQKAIPVDELPAEIRQGIPEMTVQLHVYADNPAERLVSINSRMLREGGSLNADLRLERVTADGMIFSYRGYLFWRGVR